MRTLATLLLCTLGPTAAAAALPGLEGTPSADGTGVTFDLEARPGYISTADGGSIYVWGYGPQGTMQYPGPTLLVNQGTQVTIHLANGLPEPVSIVIPGLGGVTSEGGAQGLLAQEAPVGGSVTYTFDADRPGTFLYQSGSRPGLQIEMGLVGALVVRPATPGQAYDDPDTAFDHETLFLFTEMDPRIHEAVEAGRTDGFDAGSYHPVYWFINGRTAPDTLAPDFAPWLPTQPYACIPRIHPAETLLMRMVSAGRDKHPFHTHGNHGLIVARDGRPLGTAAAGRARLDFTFTTPPGGTMDVLFTWSGAGLGWDIYGHAPEDAQVEGEYAPDHGKPFPVTLPDPKVLSYGTFYSGSPFLGTPGDLPAGHVNLNDANGYYYMWHSHTEKEMVNDNVFPGGMMTMFAVEPVGVDIP